MTTSRSMPNTAPERKSAQAGNSAELAPLLQRLDQVLQQLALWLPPLPAPVRWDDAIAFRWRKLGGRGALQPVAHPHQIRAADLLGVDRQRRLIDDNTRQYVEGRSANNVLLTGARGTGKSSLVKAMLHKYHRQGLRLIEVDKSDLVDLTEIADLVAGRPERFIVFCDDLSFEASDPGYKALKVILDGSIASASENLLVYATSNRRHLMPETMSENLETKYVGEEIHPGETTEEKVSLSERFGLWVSFYPFDQDEYLAIVQHWLSQLGLSPAQMAEAHQPALQWALLRGSRSGRIAWQFARDWAGRHGTAVSSKPSQKATRAVKARR